MSPLARAALVLLACARAPAYAPRATIAGHAVRRVDAEGLFVYGVVFGAPSDPNAAKHDALATQLWPAARVAASLLEDAPPSTVVEIGCGLGLPSLAAARAGSAALATDRDGVALEFVQAAAEDQGLSLKTARFDVDDETAPLPLGELVVFCDVFVTNAVAASCATRVAEALRRGSRCLVVDARRSTRDAFLSALRDALPGRDCVFSRPPPRLDAAADLVLADAGD